MLESRDHDDAVIQRIDQQLKRMEEIIDALLRNVNFTELNAYQQLNTAVRFLGQYQRILALRQTGSVVGQGGLSDFELAAIMRYMAGEDEEELAMGREFHKELVIGMRANTGLVVDIEGYKELEQDLEQELEMDMEE